MSLAAFSMGELNMFSSISSSSPSMTSSPAPANVPSFRDSIKASLSTSEPAGGVY